MTLSQSLLTQALQLPTPDKLQLIHELTTAVEHELSDQRHQALATTDPPLGPQPLAKITYKIIGCAMTLHRNKGPGYREDTYQRELEVLFPAQGLVCAPQKMLEVYASEQGHKLIGYYIPDFIIANQIIVEIKALHSLDNSHIAQVIGYLAVTGCKVGLLINFGQRSLQWRRILPPKAIEAHQVNRQWLFVPEWLQAGLSADSGSGLNG